MDSLDRFTTVRIGGTDYEIILDDGMLKTSEMCGMIDEASTEIRVSTEMSQQALHATLLHEMIHAILLQSGHDNSDNPDTYEPIVEALSHGFHAFLKDNVLLVCDICGIQFQLGAIDGGEEVPEDAA